MTDEAVVLSSTDPGLKCIVPESYYEEMIATFIKPLFLYYHLAVVDLAEDDSRLMTAPNADTRGAEQKQLRFQGRFL